MGHLRTDLTGFQSGVPHNPKPRTERGKRRHAARSEDEKNRAEKIWNTNPKRTFKEK